MGKMSRRIDKRPANGGRRVMMLFESENYANNKRRTWMKKMKKTRTMKHLSVVLAVAVVLAFLPGSIVPGTTEQSRAADTTKKYKWVRTGEVKSYDADEFYTEKTGENPAYGYDFIMHTRASSLYSGGTDADRFTGKLNRFNSLWTNPDDISIDYDVSVMWTVPYITNEVKAGEVWKFKESLQVTNKTERHGKAETGSFVGYVQVSKYGEEAKDDSQYDGWGSGVSCKVGDDQKEQSVSFPSVSSYSNYKVGDTIYVRLFFRATEDLQYWNGNFVSLDRGGYSWVKYQFKLEEDTAVSPTASPKPTASAKPSVAPTSAPTSSPSATSAPTATPVPTATPAPTSTPDTVTKITPAINYIKTWKNYLKMISFYSTGDAPVKAVPANKLAKSKNIESIQYGEVSVMITFKNKPKNGKYKFLLTCNETERYYAVQKVRTIIVKGKKVRIR